MYRSAHKLAEIKKIKKPAVGTTLCCYLNGKRSKISHLQREVLDVDLAWEEESASIIRK